MTLQVKYNKLENDCFNLLIVDPNPPHDLKYFSLILRLENTGDGRLAILPPGVKGMTMAFLQAKNGDVD